MIDALFSGISGLNSNQSALNTQSNNISNVNTVGYKSDTISFADLMYQQGIGKGTMVATVDKTFKQGNLKPTGNAYDLAIEGSGYFIVKGDSAENKYTRSGNFRMAQDGTLQMPNGYIVQGIVSNTPIVNSSDPTITVFNDTFSKFIASKIIKSDSSEIMQTINTKSTDYTSSAEDDDIINTGKNYKTKEAKIADIEALIFAYNSELTSYANSQTIGIEPTNLSSNIQYDTNKLISGSIISINIGINKYSVEFDNNTQQTLNNLSNLISKEKGLSASVDTNGLLSINNLIPGENISITNATISSTGIITKSTINTTQAIIGSGKAKLDALENQLKTSLTNANAKFLSINNTVDTSNIASKTLGNMQLNLSTLNISDNPFGEPEIIDGSIYLKQGDTKFLVGQIMTSMFVNEHGLTPVGSNLYSKSTSSGEPVYANSLNVIRNEVLELSNTNLAEGLVDLMVFQRAFEATSKTITTSDEFLKTAIQLKK